MVESYCLLTGGRCSHSPIPLEPHTFFISEPYDTVRLERENSITEAIKGYKFIISDHSRMNISISCKICHQIQSSQFGIVDITTSNKNVLIELGMLYGFNKPVVILIKRSSKTKIEIPSNIIGIEQIRYKDFSDLQNKLKSVLTALFEISTKQTEFLLDLKPVLEFQIEQIELAILAKYLIGENIKAELHSLKYIDGNPIIIVNKGTENGLRNNMILSVVSLGEQIGEEYLEEEVGRLVVKHVQEKICQCQLLSVDPSKQFWRDFLEKGSASKNIVKPYINEVLRKLTDEELKENLSKLKILLSGYTIRTRGG